MFDFKEHFINNFHNVLIDEPMKKHTTFKTGGNADVFVIPESFDEIKNCVSLCEDLEIPYYIVGNGSNILVGDKGFRGVIIQIFKNLSDFNIFQNSIKVQSGMSLAAVSKIAMENSLSGLEFASGIPGTVGGGVCMNAGAYGGEMKDVIKNITVLKDNNIFQLSNSDAEFEYRSSRMLKNNFIVLDAEFILEKGDFYDIKQKIFEFNKLRSEKQPLDFPSAGSTFKRPAGYFAGKLIMDAGLRGYSVGDASVSEKHCGFVINKGNASSKDILSLIEDVKNTVNKKFGVVLEPEIRIIGEF